MYRTMTLLIAVAATLFFFSGCAVNSTGKTDTSYDGLVPITVSGLDSAWARQDASLAAYDKIMLADADIQFKPVASAGLQYDRPLSRIEYPVTEDARARLEQLLNDTFAGEMGKSELFTLAQEAGPEVLLVKLSLLDAVSNVPPGRAEKASIFLDSIGEATLVLELYDSQSHAVLARGVDRRAADSPAWAMSSESADSWSEVEKVVSAWASILRSELEGVKRHLSE